MLHLLLSNRVLANLAFALVVALGLMSYLMMPREQDPSVNFNWVDITTLWPGASAEDVESLVTAPLEDAIRRVEDIKFVSSVSREGYSNIVVRFGDLGPGVFDKRVTDLRRELQNEADAELPDIVDNPVIFEATSANAFPSATLVLSGNANDELLRRQARRIRDDLERKKGVQRVLTIGLMDPELQVNLLPKRLSDYGVTPDQIANTVAGYFQDVSAGTVNIGDQEWLVRMKGKVSDPEYLAALPLSTPKGIIPLEQVSRINRGREKATQLVDYQGSPAILLAVAKKDRFNTLKLLDSINAYLADSNPLLAPRGMRIVLLDDQTPRTRKALDTMQSNAIFGLFFVLLTTWLFLGARMAFYIALGIIFTLSGIFWVLALMGHTLNTLVLLGVVIALGMLVDDAVVVVEAIYMRMRRGVAALRAGIDGLREVAAPVTTSVLTTAAAFLPLTLMPGVLGKFMSVVPLVVTMAIGISLIEAFWILPSHITDREGTFRESRSQRVRNKVTNWLRTRYGKFVAYILGRPRRFLLVLALILTSSFQFISSGAIRVEMFAADPLRLFYVNVQMPAGTALDKTLITTTEIEDIVRTFLDDSEVREITSYAGQQFTETSSLLGDEYGQTIVALQPSREGLRHVDDLIAGLRERVRSIPGPLSVTFQRLTGGPPSTKPISIKVRGEDFSEIKIVANIIKKKLAAIPGTRDVATDNSPGKPELVLRINTEAARRAGLEGSQVSRMVRLLFDGEIVANMRAQGEKVEIRVRSIPGDVQDIQRVLNVPIALPEGGNIALADLVNAETGIGKANIRHYDFRRTITVESDLDKETIDTVRANQIIIDAWQEIRDQYPDIDVRFTGELDDIEESLDSMLKLFVLGMGLVYLILGTQFRSYWQPVLILSSIPMAFTGAVFGLVITGQPLSLRTLYGMIALAGIAVNSSIVLFAAANDRMNAGINIIHATVFAARRRLIPILITSITTIAGLFSLAIGLGGTSLLWGPVAAVIVWGLGFSTVLTLIFMPLLFRLFNTRTGR